MDIEIGDKLIRLERPDLPKTMKAGKIATIKEIVKPNRVRIFEEPGIWYLEYFKKLEKIHELWI